MLSPPVALILANGSLDDPAVERRRLDDLQPASVIAADGGSRHAAPLGVRLDTIVGDLDSIGPEQKRLVQTGRVSAHPRPADKDETDLELALLHAFQQGSASAVVVGVAGGRLDMILANVMLLLHPSLSGRRVELWAGHQTAFLLTAPGAGLPGKAGDRVSLLPLGGDAEGVRTHGLEFPLGNEALRVGTARGVSNRITAAPASVELTSGALLVVHTPSGVDR